MSGPAGIPVQKVIFPFFVQLHLAPGYKHFLFFSVSTLICKLKDVSDDNWALFYTFSSEVSEKLGFRNN